MVKVIIIIERKSLPLQK